MEAEKGAGPPENRSKKRRGGEGKQSKNAQREGPECLFAVNDTSYSALDYHEETKHSELSVRTSAHYLDWEDKPSPFKVYRNLPSVALPRDFPLPEGESLATIRGDVSKTGKHADLGVLAELLFFSAGVTRRMKVGPDFYYMRAASATGALYPIELYVVSGEIPGLKAGVYHFNPLTFALVRLREGDYRAALGAACSSDCLTSLFTLAFTSLAWRNAWKYGARSYRHWFWDSGVVGANLLATATSEGLATRLDIGFVDPKVDRLLGLKSGKEATVAIASVGIGLTEVPRQERREAPEIFLEVEPLSKEEVEYPSIWKANEASSLGDLAEVENWRQGLKPRGGGGAGDGAGFPLRIPGEADMPATRLGETILRRGSTRRFARQGISFEVLSRIIDSSTAVVPLDFLPPKDSLIDFYLIVNSVQGLPSGSYFFDRTTRSLAQLKEGQFRTMSAYLCLEQPLFGDASVVFFLMADLGQAVSSLGDRGYRAAQFEAGVRAGKVYLSSYSLEIGASGSTFYDDAVTEFFSPHAKGKSTMITVGVGVPAYKAKAGGVLPQFQNHQS
jgi:SagB-type dehydrogenase family enzyme